MGVTPANTDKTTKCAVSNFEAWKEATNQKYLDDQVPDNLFMCTDPAILSIHLSRFLLCNLLVSTKCCRAGEAGTSCCGTRGVAST